MIFGRKKRSIVRLLVVEDEPLVAFDTEHVLSEQDYEIVATVDRVAHAVAILDEADDIHLVLADIALADGSGIEVAQAAARRGVPVMFVTGNCPGDAEALAVACLSKPYAPRDLIAAIEAIEAAREGKTTRRLPNGFRLFAGSDPSAGGAAAIG
ncbi:response regulator [Sphingomonas mucosissima]|uniref:Putative transcriptional regulatory protein pdtaR n=1 Tax=Sphingomonas mucosissima TaxID=370959 RepID=A0A245ZG66_9SPHN|nr:response regulator [Sphingomonas mucosissima]OWK28718.1 putative transcriptional regulatory protein pdtaR [Sphingomonas mucosissima]